MKYLVVERQLVYQYWLHEVEADSEDEAIEKAENGEGEPSDDHYGIDNSYSDEYEYVIKGYNDGTEDED